MGPEVLQRQSTIYGFDREILVDEIRDDCPFSFLDDSFNLFHIHHFSNHLYSFFLDSLKILKIKVGEI